MAVTRIGIEDTLGGAVGNLARSAGELAEKTIFKRRVKEREISGNIELMKGMATGLRAAIEAGQEEVFLEAIGVRPEFRKKLLSFQAEEDELTEIANIQAGGPELKAKAAVGEARVSIEESAQILAQGAPEAIIGAKVGEAQVSIAETAAALDKNLATLNALAAAKVASLTIEEATAILGSGVFSAEVRARIGEARLTIEEIRTLILEGVPGKEAEARGVVAEATTKAAEVELTSNIAQARVDAEKIELAFKTDSFNAFRELGGIRLEALGATSGLRAQRHENLYQAQYFSVLNSNGVPMLKADLEKTSTMLEKAKVDFNTDQLEGYITVMNGIDQSTPEGRKFVQMANTFMINPSFGQFLGQEAQRDFNVKLAALDSIQTPQEMVRFTAELQGEIDTRFKTLQEARDDKADDDVIRALSLSYNNMVDIARDLSTNGRILPLDLTFYSIEQEALAPEKFTSNFVLTQARAFNESLESSISNFLHPFEQNAQRVATVQEAITNFDALAAASEWDSKEKREMLAFLVSTLNIVSNPPGPATRRPGQLPFTPGRFRLSDEDIQQNITR
jgi:hypothetical protein